MNGDAGRSIGGIFGMGRQSIIKPVILEVLRESKIPLRFSELKQRVVIKLGRKRLDDKQFYVNLQKSMDEGLVEKMLMDGKITYKLTSSYYEQQLKSTLVRLLNERKLSQLYDGLEADELPPHIVFLDPPAYDYRSKKPIQKLDRSETYLAYGGGPMQAVGESRIIPNWSHPCSAIASIMLNDFYGLLTSGERENAIKLIRWAYWTACRSFIEKGNFLGGWPEVIDRNRKFALQCIEKFKEDHKRVEVEKALLKILDITEELISKNNLAEFLSYLYEKTDEHRRLLNKIMFHEGFLGGGEKIYESFMEFGSMVVSGLFSAGVLHDDLPLNQKPIRERLFLTTSKVWDEFFSEIIRGPFSLPETLKENPEFTEVKGTLDAAVARVRELKSYLNPILDLPFTRRMAIVYLWGFPETLYLSSSKCYPHIR